MMQKRSAREFMCSAFDVGCSMFDLLWYKTKAPPPDFLCRGSRAGCDINGNAGDTPAATATKRRGFSVAIALGGLKQR
jgi:hypothetical protein